MIFVLLAALASAQDCLSLPSSLCLAGGNYTFAGRNIPSSLVGWWTADDSQGHDYSGNNNTITDLPQAGPAIHGKGASLLLNGTSMAVVPHISAYEMTEFTYSFWYFLREDSNGAFRTVMRRGESVKELSPGVFLWPNEKRLHVRISTQYNWNEGLDSLGVIGLKRWTHLAVSANGQLLQLFVNGYTDSFAVLKAQLKPVSSNLYVGADPWHMGAVAYLDDLRIYNKALQGLELEVLAAPAFGLIRPSSAKLGCDSCTFLDAQAACYDVFHLCSLKELYAGAYSTARIQGWLRMTGEVWSRNTDDETTTSTDEMMDDNLFKVGVCCADF
jgi:hypothetical protein